MTAAAPVPHQRPCTVARRVERRNAWRDSSLRCHGGELSSPRFRPAPAVLEDGRPLTAQRAAPMPQETAAAVRTIADLVSHDLAVGSETSMGDVVRLFERHADADSIAVLAKPRILFLSRTRFFIQLGRRFGYSLFENRSVLLLAEEGSVVEASTEPLEVIQLATQREASRVYDDIVVVEGGRYRGMVSMRSLLVHHKDLLVASVAELSLLDERNRRLEEVNRYAAELVSRVTQGLRTPLDTVTAIARAILADPELSGRQAAHVRSLLARSRDALAVLESALDLSRIESGLVAPAAESVDLQALLTEALASAEPYVDGRPVRLQINLRGIPPLVRTDASVLKHVVAQPLGNAVDFTDMGTIELGAEGEGEGLRIWVRDTGFGIRAEDQPRLFTRFACFEPARQRRRGGTGIGLVIAKGLVEALGGAIRI